MVIRFDQFLLTCKQLVSHPCTSSLHELFACTVVLFIVATCFVVDAGGKDENLN